MTAVMPAEAWFVLSALLSPVGYVIQDVVADAMTVEAVPRVDENGKPVPQEARKLMNTTMQTLGRVALIGGLALVAAFNLYLFADVEKLSEAEKLAVYRTDLPDRDGDPIYLRARNRSRLFHKTQGNRATRCRGHGAERGTGGAYGPGRPPCA